MALSRTARQRIRINFDLYKVWRKLTELYLQLKVMLSIVCLNSHLAYSHIGPTFSERPLPIEDARGG